MAKQDLSTSPNDELRAMKWFTVSHGLGLAIFLGLMITFFWYLQHIEQAQVREMMYRDIEWAQQSMRLKWRELQDDLQAPAPQLSGPMASSTSISRAAS